MMFLRTACKYEWCAVTQVSGRRLKNAPRTGSPEAVGGAGAGGVGVAEGGARLTPSHSRQDIAVLVTPPVSLRP